ncbi:hypothetical protein OE88DRAFT_1503044 [Heliocybe sulcata]|uniref:Uncharacterized protein n=1 Tax=Heliocybe sulcata TaxID=5364 RepID=A0A5C3N3Y1_9AGAM|nr:hypothetical protein OE88DRAFT_1503044 [Heliocybe sulcata]
MNGPPAFPFLDMPTREIDSPRAAFSPSTYPSRFRHHRAYPLTHRRPVSDEVHLPATLPCSRGLRRHISTPRERARRASCRQPIGTRQQAVRGTDAPTSPYNSSRLLPRSHCLLLACHAPFRARLRSRRAYERTPGVHFPRAADTTDRQPASWAFSPSTCLSRLRHHRAYPPTYRRPVSDNVHFPPERRRRHHISTPRERGRRASFRTTYSTSGAAVARETVRSRLSPLGLFAAVDLLAYRGRIAGSSLLYLSTIDYTPRRASKYRYV